MNVIERIKALFKPAPPKKYIERPQPMTRSELAVAWLEFAEDNPDYDHSQGPPFISVPKPREGPNAPWPDFKD